MLAILKNVVTLAHNICQMILDVLKGIELEAHVSSDHKPTNGQQPPIEPPQSA